MKRFAGLLLPALLAGAAYAAEERGPSEETPYVTSPSVVVDAMLEMAKVTEQDFVIDLGSGDGRIVIEAAKRFKAHGCGLDYDARLVKLATENAQRAGVADRVAFYERDIFKTDFSQATVVTMYLLPEYNALLKSRLLALRPGTRIVSHDYGIDDWPPDAEQVIPVPDKPVGARKESVIYAWTVPAKVAGTWRSRIPTAQGAADLEFDLKQHYQSFAGTARVGGRAAALERTLLKGSSLSFSLESGGETLHFQAQVFGDSIAGQVLRPGGAHRSWQAFRQRAGQAKVSDFADSGPRRFRR